MGEDWLQDFSKKRLVCYLRMQKLRMLPPLKDRPGEDLLMNMAQNPKQLLTFSSRVCGIGANPNASKHQKSSGW